MAILQVWCSPFPGRIREVATGHNLQPTGVVPVTIMYTYSHS